MLWVDPRSTSSHCGSENALDQRVVRFPSVALDAGQLGPCIDDAVVGWCSAMFVVPQVAADAFGAARPATSAVSTRAMAARTAVAALRDGPAHPPDPGGRRGGIRMFISPPMCQLCAGRREKGRLAGLSTRLIS